MLIIPNFLSDLDFMGISIFWLLSFFPSLYISTGRQNESWHLMVFPLQEIFKVVLARMAKLSLWNNTELG